MPRKAPEPELPPEQLRQRLEASMNREANAHRVASALDELVRDMVDWLDRLSRRKVSGKRAARLASTARRMHERALDGTAPRESVTHTRGFRLSRR